jgi:hypothetical protein
MYGRKPRRRTVFVGFTSANGIDAFSDVVPICQLCVSLLSRPPVQLATGSGAGSGKSSYRHTSEKGSWRGLTVMAATFHSALILGISLWAVLRPSLTPVRNLIVKGISPSALFIPIRIFPSFPAASSTVSGVLIKIFCYCKADATKGRTSGTTASLEDKVDWTSAVHVHKVDAAPTFFRYHFCCRDERGRFAPRDLYSKHCLGWVSSDQGPLFLGTGKERRRQAH